MIEGERGRFSLHGPLTLANVRDFLNAKDAMFRDAAGEVQINLAQVHEVDSSAVALLLEYKREAVRRGCAIAFLQPNENLRTLIGLYEVGDLLGF